MSDSTLQKYAHIRKEYSKLFEKRYKGIRIYTNEYIFKKLSEQFYLAPRTIENIVFYRVSCYPKENK
ncbi:MAG: hypothetical protein COB73_00860 [Flavobacteriaceae bacterium]|nr:MAG: hypothetical protein COB73_00860 [Flavobacteriaceae bacterium]